MLRTASMVAMLAAVVAWLVFSYWPAGAAALPTLAFGADAGPTLALLAAAALAVTAAVQVWIVFATVRPLRRPADAAQAAVLEQFRLNVRTETLLTAAPLIITLALAGLIYLLA